LFLRENSTDAIVQMMQLSVFSHLALFAAISFAFLYHA